MYTGSVCNSGGKQHTERMLTISVKCANTGGLRHAVLVYAQPHSYFTLRFGKETHTALGVLISCMHAVW